MARILLAFAALVLLRYGTDTIPIQKPEPAKAPSPNIVFVLVDDLGWADGSCFGSQFYQTPNLDKLASNGTRFTQAYAACAVCSPTRASLLTGKYPARLHLTDWIPGESAPNKSRFKVPSWQQSLPIKETTLAEVLKKLGYVTANIGKWHLGGAGSLPQDHGFDLNVAGGDTGHPASFFWPFGAKNDSHRVPELAERGGKDGDYLTDQLTDEALQFIEKNKAKPFYLNLCHYAVHAPLMGKSELIERASLRPPANGQGNTTYASMLMSVDQSLGRIMHKLDELHLSKNTLIVFTSDNGGAVHFGKPIATSNWPLRDGKGSAYEGGLRVPLIVKRPGQVKGDLCETPVITMDFFPTLAALAGAPRSLTRTAVDGKNFLPVLKSSKVPLHSELFWHYPHYWNGGKVSPYSVARIGDWKLIRCYESGRDELYNLKNDISETNDLSAGNPAKTKVMVDRLNAWLKSVGAQLPELRQ